MATLHKNIALCISLTLVCFITAPVAIAFTIEEDGDMVGLNGSHRYGVFEQPNGSQQNNQNGQDLIDFHGSNFLTWDSQSGPFSGSSWYIVEQTDEDCASLNFDDCILEPSFVSYEPYPPEVYSQASYYSQGSYYTQASYYSQGSYIAEPLYMYSVSTTTCEDSGSTSLCVTNTQEDFDYSISIGIAMILSFMSAFLLFRIFLK